MTKNTACAIFSVALVACEFHASTGPSHPTTAQNPPPAARPPSPPPAAAPPPARAPQAAPPVHRVVVSSRVKLGTGDTVPVVTAANAFGGSEETLDSLRGVVYFIPEGTKKFPDVSNLKPTAALFTKELNISPRNFQEGFPGVDGRFEWFAIRYEGNFTTTVASGDYKFRVVSDDGALVYVDNVLLLDNDGEHAPTERQTSIKLSKGSHALRVDYFQGPRYQIALQLFVTPPGATERLWSSSL